MLSKEQFATLFPKVSPVLQDVYHQALLRAMQEFGIDTFQRIAAFLAQVGHETMGLRYLQELGGPAYFSKYDGRADLGNTQPGDGARFHGRGMIQLTGRANYKEFGEVLGLNLLGQPEIAAEPTVGARIAALFWDSRGCSELADVDNFIGITRKINGGTNGLDDRLRRWEHAKRVLGLRGAGGSA